MINLTLDQRATNFETMQHIHQVQSFLHLMAKELLDRADLHDLSKLVSPEVELFTECTARLAGCTYGSPEYAGFVEELKPALQHHYARNRHHPEHFKSGINDMNLLDLLEMFCDWKAATMRHNDGNLRKSIEHNANRFEMSPQLVRIFENTVEIVEV